MPVLDARSLNEDPEGLAFLRGALGTSAGEPAERRFPVELWSAPQGSEGYSAFPLAPSPERVEPRFAEALA